MQEITGNAVEEIDGKSVSRPGDGYGEQHQQKRPAKKLFSSDNKGKRSPERDPANWRGQRGLGLILFSHYWYTSV